MVSINEQGQASAPDVVNWRVAGWLMGVPPELRAPETVTEYFVPGSKEELGRNVTFVPDDSLDAVPVTEAPSLVRLTVTTALPGWTGESKVIVTRALVGTDLASSPGEVERTLGA